MRAEHVSTQHVPIGHETTEFLRIGHQADDRVEPAIAPARRGTQIVVATPERFRSDAGLLGAISVLFWMMWPMLRIPLGVIDDHEIVDIIGNRSRLPFSRMGTEIASRWNEPIGRFRPGYWVFRVFESATAGRNTEWWFINRFVLAAITLAAIYHVARRHIGVVASAVVALVPFLGPQFETWRRLGVNETYAVRSCASVSP